MHHNFVQTKIAEVEQEKKALQDTVTEKSEALQKSEESKQAMEIKCQQLLEELEQYKVSYLRCIRSKATNQ